VVTTPELVEKVAKILFPRERFEAWHDALSDGVRLRAVEWDGERPTIHKGFIEGKALKIAASSFRPPHAVARLVESTVKAMLPRRYSASEPRHRSGECEWCGAPPEPGESRCGYCLRSLQ
jgi:hypothetical protein